MADHRASTTPVTAMLKRIPGLVTGVKHLRAAWRRSGIAMIACTIRWDTATSPRRLLAFGDLTDRLFLPARPA